MFRPLESRRSTPAVTVRRESVVYPTYVPAAPDRNPIFLEKRVYQGSSGRVYPLPIIDRIASEPVERAWDAVILQNDFIEVMILPEIGGRIHAGKDRTNGYDFFYRQNVIKPALVGLAGPWISGGVEFNWPQHHRPATFLPVDVEIENGADGSITVWCGDHDPMTRMKGMHGVCLYPDRAFIELKVRVYNPTPFAQTFLWWANVATRVHEAYQSFFPPDAYYVADHARRSMSDYPLCRGRYYGIDYGTRGQKGVPESEAPANFLPPNDGGVTPVAYTPDDLSFYANIPVPTSYMCMGSQKDFFGGYDHARQAGVVHVANHHIAPGKKQWTWGNHAFGYAWDRSLTDADGPYIELMAGVYTDNQPDFSFLMPGETKTWSQFWYPIQTIGPAQQANREAALSLRVQGRVVVAGVSISSVFKAATVTLLAKGKVVATFTRDLAGSAFLEKITLPRRAAETDLLLRVFDRQGSEVIAFAPKPRIGGEVPPPAAEPPSPEATASVDELYLNGLHLEQCRHSTRAPEAYWFEALRRDPGETRCNNALGLWRLRRGEFAHAEKHFRAAIGRLTQRNANPRDGEAHYKLGLTLRFLRRDEDAYAAFYKSAWNQAWQGAAYHALAELDCRRADWVTALDHLDRSLRLNTDNLQARDLRELVLRKLGREAEAEAQLRATLARNPLDGWARWLLGDMPLTGDTQTRLDMALAFARGGFYQEAIAVLAEQEPTPGTAPLVDYYRGWLHTELDEPTKAASFHRAAAKAAPDYCFPSRLEEILILKSAMQANPADARAFYYLGNLLYDRRCHAEAIQLWEKSAKLDPGYSVVWRNLGLGYFNVSRQPAKARAAYDRAFRANPTDARLLYERDQLWKKLGKKPDKRLRELEKHLALVQQRDDLSVELCVLYNQVGRPGEALQILGMRKFQPWEGGEGQVLGQYVRAHVALGRAALARNEANEARSHFEQALTVPENLSEARHLLANLSEVHYWLGTAFDRLGEKALAEHWWTLAAAFRGDFQEMSVRAFSAMTYYTALAMRKLGNQTDAQNLLQQLLAYARDLEKAVAKVDFFAASLPTMLLFEDDIQLSQKLQALFLQSQAHLGLGRRKRAKNLLATVLRLAPSHGLAFDPRKNLNLESKN